MFGYIRVVVFLSVVVYIDCLLTKECADATNQCMESLTQNLFNGTQFCSAMEQYFPCVAKELSRAEASEACDQLTILFKKATELRTLNDLVTSESCDLKAPPELQLDDCSREMAKCGQLAVKASVATDTKTKCSDIEDFIACMASDTPSCGDFDLVQTLVEKEIGHDLYQSDCFDLVPVTTGTTGSTARPEQPVTLPVVTGTTHTPIPTTKSWRTDDSSIHTGTVTPLTTTRPSSAGSQGPAVTLADLNTLKNDFQKSLDLQTRAIEETLKEHLQGLQDRLPSNLLLTGQLTDILTRTSSLEKLLKEEFRTHSDRLQQILQNLVNDLSQDVNEVPPVSSQTNSVYPGAAAAAGADLSFKKNTPTTSLGCVEKVMKVLGEVSLGESWSAEHYVKVARLGVKGGMSPPQSVMVMFSRPEDRLVAFIKGKEALERERVTVEMYPSYFKFTCAA